MTASNASRFRLHALAVSIVVSAACLTDACAQVRDTIVITGTRHPGPALETPFAISVVDSEQVRAAGPMVNLSESMASVPGLTVANRHNYAQDLQISVRGFGARASFGVRGIRLYSDGIPATMPDGSGQVSHFDLAGARRIEVLRGPFSALYGNSSGGVIALLGSEPERSALGLDLDVGSHGTRQWRLRADAVSAGPWSMRAALSRFTTDGFRPHSRAERTLGNVRVVRAAGDDRLVLLGSILEQPADDPLGLTREQFEADPRQTAAPAISFGTRKTLRQQQAGVNWTRALDAGPLRELGLMAYLGRRAVMQWQSIPVAAQAAETHPGGVIDLDRDYGGAALQLTLGSDATRWVAGLTADRQSDDRRGYENFADIDGTRVLGVTGNLRRAERNRAASADAYLQGEWQLGPRLALHAGLRGGSVELRAEDRYLANGDDGGSSRFRYANPVLGARWQAAQELMLYASVGRGYETPTLNEVAYRADGQSGFNAQLRAQRSRHVEAGLKWRPRSDATLEVAAFDALTRDEIVVASNSGGRSTFRNAARTRRGGLEVAADAKLAGGLSARAALTWLDARFDEAFDACATTPCTTPNAVVAKGNRIAGTARHSAYVGFAWRPNADHELGLEWRGKSAAAVNDLNSDFAPGHGLLALRATSVLLRSSDGATVELFARLDNALDQRHVGSVIVNEGNARNFEPGMPRTLSVGLRWTVH